MNVPAQYRPEWAYLVTERLGIMLDGRGQPTPAQVALARSEADEWVKQAIKREDLDAMAVEMAKAELTQHELE